MNNYRVFGLLVCALAAGPARGGVPPDAAAPTLAVDHDQLEDFFMQQKKGTPLELTLDKGKVVQGVFSSYDDYYETVWILPRRSEQGVFREKGFKLSGVKKAALWDKKESLPKASPDVQGTPDDYYLLRENGIK